MDEYVIYEDGILLPIFNFKINIKIKIVRTAEDIITLIRYIGNDLYVYICNTEQSDQEIINKFYEVMSSFSDFIIYKNSLFKIIELIFKKSSFDNLLSSTLKNIYKSGCRYRATIF